MWKEDWSIYKKTASPLALLFTFLSLHFTCLHERHSMFEMVPFQYVFIKIKIKRKKNIGKIMAQSFLKSVKGDHYVGESSSGALISDTWPYHVMTENQNGGCICGLIDILISVFIFI